MISAFVAAALLGAAPNVVLLSVDTLRADRLGCYGYPHATSPNIDALAAEGLLFEDVLAEVPLTNPSFGAMMTSRYPRMTGVTRNGLPMPETVPKVAELFRDAGYQTLCVQSNWTLKSKLSGLHHGFDVYDDHFHTRRWGIIKSERYADEVTDIALTLLRERDANRPMFLWVHYSDPHAPYRHHREFAPSDDAYPGHDKVNRVRRGYDSEIAYMDSHIARFLAALPKESTFIVFVADHGESLFEHDYLGHGRRIYQTCVRVPLIVKGPGIAPGRNATPGRLLDIGPTLLALAGLEPAAGMLGHNLLSPEGAPPNARFVETYGGAVPNLPGAKALMADQPPIRRGVVQEGWKLILGGERVELFNLRDDPMETNNLAEKAPDKVSELEALIRQFEANVKSRPRTQAPLDEQDIEALKSLGYIQ